MALVPLRLRIDKSAFVHHAVSSKVIMLSQTVEYALRAVVHLAMRAPEPQTTAAIADVTKVPPAYLAKVLQGLKERTSSIFNAGSAAVFRWLSHPMN